MVSPNASLAAIEDKLLYPDDHLIWCSKLDSGPHRGHQLPGGANIQFSQKLHEIERIWAPRGSASLAPPRSAFVVVPHILENCISCTATTFLLEFFFEMHKNDNTGAKDLCMGIVQNKFDIYFGMRPVAKFYLRNISLDFC